MTDDLTQKSKADILSILAKEAAAKIEVFETDLAVSIEQMDKLNLPHYLKGQNELIQRWRNFLGQLKKYQHHGSTHVEDGALVKIAGYPQSEWVLIHKLQTRLIVNGTTVEINDGQLGRVRGTIQGAHPGDTITLYGDERSLSDINVRILQVL